MTTEKRNLTPEDPVTPEVLAEFSRLQESKHQLAVVAIQLDMDKIEVLRSIGRLDEQNKRLFEACLIERGLPPDAPIEIDSKTGKITLRCAVPTPVTSEAPNEG